MDDRVEGLLKKAEEAIDRNDLDQADAYAMLASRRDYLRRKEAKAMNRMIEEAADA